MFTATATALPPLGGPAAPTVTTFGSFQGIDVGELLDVGQVYAGVHIELSPAAARTNPNKSATTSIATRSTTSNPNGHRKGSQNPTMTADTPHYPATPPAPAMRPDQQPVDG